MHCSPTKLSALPSQSPVTGPDSTCTVRPCLSVFRGALSPAPHETTSGGLGTMAMCGSLRPVLVGRGRWRPSPPRVSGWERPRARELLTAEGAGGAGCGCCHRPAGGPRGGGPRSESRSEVAGTWLRPGRCQASRQIHPRPLCSAKVGPCAHRKRGGRGLGHTMAVSQRPLGAQQGLLFPDAEQDGRQLRATVRLGAELLGGAVPGGGAGVLRSWPCRPGEPLGGLGGGQTALLLLAGSLTTRT